MSFRCEDCEKISKPREKSVRKVVETTTVTHRQVLLNPETERYELLETGTGTQIKREKTVCVPCAGLQEVTQ